MIADNKAANQVAKALPLEQQPLYVIRLQAEDAGIVTRNNARQRKSALIAQLKKRGAQ